MKNRTENETADDLIALGISCIEFLDQKKAGSPVFLDLRKVNTYLDFFIIATGNSHIHCRSLAKEIEKKLYDEGLKQFGRPDYDSDWIIIDFGSIIVHIFTEETRNYYQLEKLWGDSVKYSVNEVK